MIGVINIPYNRIEYRQSTSEMRGEAWQKEYHNTGVADGFHSSSAVMKHKIKIHGVGTSFGI